MTHSNQNASSTRADVQAVDDDVETGRAAALTGSALFTAIAGIVLVDAELLAVAGTAGYALANYFQAGPVGIGVIAAAIGVPAAWLCYQVARLAIAGEREHQS